MVPDKKIFSCFTNLGLCKQCDQQGRASCDLDMQLTEAIRTISKKEGHKRIIPTKFGQNPSSSLGGDVL